MEQVRSKRGKGSSGGPVLHSRSGGGPVRIALTSIGVVKILGQSTGCSSGTTGAFRALRREREEESLVLTRHTVANRY